MEEKKEKSRYTKFTFSLTDEQLAWLRSKGDEGYNISRIIQKMIDSRIIEEQKKEDGK